MHVPLSSDILKVDILVVLRNVYSFLQSEFNISAWAQEDKNRLGQGTCDRNSHADERILSFRALTIKSILCSQAYFVELPRLPRHYCSN